MTATRLKRYTRYFLMAGVGLGLGGLLAVLGGYLYVSPALPSVETLKDIQFQVPLRVYSAEGELISEFGQKRRDPIRYDDIPPLMVQAVLSAEDDRFFEHPGVDYQGLVRAVGLLVLTGKKVQGGSTITMQVARNFFLSREKTYLRKFSEILLALKIEQELSKEDILELYFNKIYLGNRSYGFAAAAQVYYGKSLDELNVAQWAMLAGLPKAPSRYNPIVNPSRALTRRNYVLGRMRDLGYIDDEAYREGVLAEVTAELHQKPIELQAPYAAEMVRQEMVERFGDEAYTAGYTVHTTIEGRLQRAANHALRKALLEYETRHGYRGPVKQLDTLEFADIDAWQAELDALESYPDLTAGVVVEVEEKSALVYLADGRLVELCWPALSWAAPYVDGNRTGPKPQTAAEVIMAGDVIRVAAIGKRKSLMLVQVPEVEGALVSLGVKNGAVKAVVGGFDFYHSKFNRAAQAKRQPGSNFKPFVYSAALEKGYTAATRINDAPVVFKDPGLEDYWRPENYSGKFFGPTRFREALVKSRNLVSIRILRSVGVKYAVQYVERFGFDADTLPKDLSLALGSASVTPLDVVQGYAVFANGGYRVDPFVITRIEGPDGEILYEADPYTVCPECEKAELERQQREAEERQRQEERLLAAGLNSAEMEDELLMTPVLELDEAAEEPVEGNPEPNTAPRVVSEQNVYVMNTILRDIVQRGTGRRAKSLGRNDLAGKTGTTNDQRDAWFSGFNGEIATTAWVGFDRPQPLGDRESGARAALPMWIDYMAEALRGVPETPLVQPPGIVSMRIDPETGLLAGAGFPGAIFEVFREQYAPSKRVETGGGKSGTGKGDGSGVPEDLF